MPNLPKPFVRMVTSEKKEATVASWVPRVTQKSRGLVALQLKSRHGVTTDHLTPEQARELSNHLLTAATAAEKVAEEHATNEESRNEEDGNQEDG